MAFENPSNRGRALKIVDILAHVEKSAKSNRAAPDEIAQMLAPVVDMLRLMGALDGAAAAAAGADRGPSQPAPDAPAALALRVEAGDWETPLAAAEVPGGRWSADRNAPAYAIIRDAAASAPLGDLAAAMAVYATRMDEALDALGRGAA